MGCDFIRLTLLVYDTVSIHAPTWGATTLRVRFLSSSDGFNPRTHMGCDPRDRWQLRSGFCFNPRTHMGCDKKYLEKKVLANVSIHAPTWGATKLYEIAEMIWQFQSTHPHGVRHTYYFLLWTSSRVSIHAPTWGATQFVKHNAYDNNVSIHAPTWGATL